MHAIAQDRRVKSTAFRIYFRLAAELADDRGQFELPVGQIAAQLGLGINQVHRALTNLADAGWIEKHEPADVTKPLRYVLVDTNRCAA